MLTSTRSEVEQRLYENARRQFLDGWEEDFRSRVKRKPSVWASEVRKIAEGTGVATNSETDYDHAVMPHCVEIMDAADDPTVSEIVMWMGIRDGKTNAVCMNLIGRCVTDDPGNICSVHPIEDDSDRFSQGDVEPTIRACLEGYFVENKSRDSGRTINFKKFKGGWLRIFSAGSATKFRGTAVKLMLLHELDALDPDAIFKAMGRTTGFPDSTVVKESTGTLAAEIDPVSGKKVYRSRIEEAYDQGDKRKWFCKCKSCGFAQKMEFAQIKHPPRRMDLAKYHCKACDYAHTPKECRKMVGSGKWYPTAGLSKEEEQDIERTHHRARAINPTVRSYWRNGFNSLLPHHQSYKSKLHEFVSKGAAAQTSEEARKIWIQEMEVGLWSPESEGESPPAWKPLFDRRESYGLTVPLGGLFLTAFCDVQKYRLEAGWRAFGRNEENWGMDHHVIEGYVGDASTWRELRFHLARKWRHALGANIALGMAFVDGGKWPDQVYKFFQELARDPMPGVTGHCRASKGFGQHGHPIVAGRMMTVGKVLKGHHIGTWAAKDRIYERLRMKGGDESCSTIAVSATPSEPRIVASTKGNAPETFDPNSGQRVDVNTREGFMHFNERYSEDYFQQLTVERVTIEFEKGQEVRKYVNPGGMRNEALDIEVGCLAAYRLYPRNLDQLEEELKAQVNPPQEDAPQQDFGITRGRGWRL